MEDLISVIIPIYNVEKYLPKCLSSVLAQTYKKLEVILVDDGSSDGSGAICDSFAEKDSRVKAIHKQNGGVSAARNDALDIATGDYIGFVDGDDWIEPEYFEKLHSACRDNDADIAACNIYGWYYIDGSFVCKKDSIEYSDCVMTRDELSDNMKLMQGEICNKLFKRELIGNTRFKTEFHASEDTYFVIENLAKANRAVFLSYYGYNYFKLRPGNVKTSDISEKYLTILDSTEAVCELMSKEGPKGEECGAEYLAYHLESCMKKLFTSRNISRETERYAKKRIRRHIKKHFARFKKYKTKKYCIMLILFYVSPPLCKAAMKYTYKKRGYDWD